MSLAETQQIYDLLVKIDALLSDVEVKTANINSDLPTTKDSLATFRQLERVAIRYLAIAKQMGLPDDVGRAINLLTRLVVIIRMAQISINMMMLETPYGWAMGIAGLTMTTISMGGMLEGY